jgi:hypothetical protein
VDDLLMVIMCEPLISKRLDARGGIFGCMDIIESNSDAVEESTPAAGLRAYMDCPAES